MPNLVLAVSFSCIFENFCREDVASAMAQEDASINLCFGGYILVGWRFWLLKGRI